MGRKGSWIAAIKKAFNSKEKPSNEISEKRSRKVKSNLREGSSFIPIFRQPSSIEKILGEVEREHHSNKVLNRPLSLQLEKRLHQADLPPRSTSSRHGSLRIGSPRDGTSPRAATSPQAPSPKSSLNRNISPSISLPKAASSKTVQRNKPTTSYRPEPTLTYRHVSATKIQAAYRGYMARRSFRALRGLLRLQEVVRGQNVQRQTANAMKHMQMMVRVRTQIQSRRIQLLENQALHHHNQYKTENDIFSKWRMAYESGNADWEDSVLMKEEIEARMQRKMEAAVKRERAMAYAYSHSHMQLKGTTKPPQDTFMDHHSGSFPWWWNWLERRLPSTQHQETPPALRTPNHSTPARTVLPNRTSPSPSPQPQSRNYKQKAFESDAYESLTPRSTKSSFIPRWKPSQTPTPGRVTQLKTKTPSRTKHSKPRPTGAESPFDATIKDDDSLNSCPPFSAPSYMAPTASAKAKVKPGNTPKDQVMATATPSRRFSFPLSQGIGSFKWNKGSSSIFSNKDAKDDRKLEKVESFHSAGNLSAESTTSLPAGGTGGKPFNRFV